MVAQKTREYLPSPAQIRLRAAAILREKGIDVDLPADTPTDDDDWTEWEMEQAVEAEMTSAELRKAEEADRKEAAQLTKQDKARRRASIYRDMSKGVPQREADANDGTEAKPGKPRSHWKAWQARRLAKEALLAGASIEETIERLGMDRTEASRVWLANIKADMEQRMRELVAKVTKMTGERPWRVTDQTGQLLKTQAGLPVDNGGYDSPEKAAKHAAQINSRPGGAGKATKRQKRAARSAEIKAKRAGRGGRVHDV
ncbi:MAG: hypothetical protein KGL39_46160 [Patescibacteria group bacterium]|nr:hypothetical protein [Patescibacteria group bacterium]